MSRSVMVLMLALAAAVASAHGQGISSVTRRTPTAERQAPVRAFFDAAGISLNGGAANGAQPLAATPTARLPLRPGVVPPAGWANRTAPLPLQKPQQPQPPLGVQPPQRSPAAIVPARGTPPSRVLPPVHARAHLHILNVPTSTPPNHAPR